ncbi:hypothetical protein [Flammeovirga sp. EKP202]|uniref:hypothetical protein n=1 Tax=Flammeovirga sp. EKP202 TaxID=2770592 RepID=UPI00165EFA38|nr:hypothetical protein [Flammeovirga sp. EKP202]MBD0405460.1 hypothetical protein [Flammeovirga sp. EKP202]
MKLLALLNVLFITLCLISCGFNPSDFNDVGIKPLESKSIAIPLLDGNVELVDLLDSLDRSSLHTDATPWYLEYKSWETQAQKDTIKPLITGKDILNDPSFKLQTGLSVPLLASFENIILNKEVIIPVTTVNPFFDVNLLEVAKGEFIASFINKADVLSFFSIELIQYNNSNDTTILDQAGFLMQPNVSTELKLEIINSEVNTSSGISTALRLKNAVSGQNAPYTVAPSPNQGIQINEVGGLHFTPFVDIDLDIPIAEKSMDINIFENSLEGGSVTLSEFQLDIVSYNTFGLDIFAGNIEVLAQSSIDDSLVPIVFSSSEIGRPRNQLNEKIDTLTFLKPEAALDVKPNKLIMRGDFQIQMRKGIDYYVEDDSYIKEQFIAKIPFEIGMDNVTFSTSILRVQDFQESINSIDSATIRLGVENHFPMSGVLSIYTKDAIDDEAPYQIDLSSEMNQNDFVFMKSATIDANNQVVAPTTLQSTFRITKEDAQRLVDAKYIYIEGRFSTPDGKIVPFLPGQRLLLKAGIFASITLSPDDL